MQAKICWKINGDTSVEQSMTRDCGLVPIMVRVRMMLLRQRSDLTRPVRKM